MKDVDNDKPGEASIRVDLSLDYATFVNDSDREAAAGMTGFGLAAVYAASSPVCTVDLSPTVQQFNSPDPVVRPITLNGKRFCGVSLGGARNGYGLLEDFTFAPTRTAKHVPEAVVDRILPELNRPVTVIGVVEGRNEYAEWRTVDRQCRLSYPEVGYDFYSPVLPNPAESCP